MAQSIAARGSTSNPSGKGICKATWQKLRDNAMNKTEFYDISQQSKLLPELRTGSSVHPQLETVDFYKKKRMSLDDYIPQTLRLHNERKLEHEIGYRKDITLKDILGNFKDGQISFVGQAGSGKTTLLKAITRQVIEGKYKNLSSIEVVHFVHLRTFKRNDLVTPAELLFRNVTPEMSDAEMNEAMQYAKDNPDKVLFVIDSLDTVSYTIDGVYTGITTEDPASPEAILFHLLSGNLLPGCRFITSSREYAIRNYKGDVRAKQVIALAGLTKESMRKVVVGYVGEEKAEEKITYLKLKPVIESLCATPVWLIFTLMVLSISSEFTPTTMAGILVILLQNMIRSEHVYEGNIEDIVCKLAIMAFTGTKERRVEFSLEELGNFNLSASEICDLMVATPSGGYQKLILGDSILMFAHQCLQEILTAFHIAKMDLEEFNSNYIDLPRDDVVRRLLAGILLNSEVFEKAENFLQDATDFEQKMLCLTDDLHKKLSRDTYSKDHLRRLSELYMILSEAGDGARDIIRRSVYIFDFSEMTPSVSEAYAIGWVMSQRTSIKIANLKRWNFTQASLYALYHGLLESGDCQLDDLDVSHNTFGPDEMMVIGQICKQREVYRFRVHDCKFLSGALASFLVHSVGAKLHEFDISYNGALGPDEMALIAKIFVQCKVKISKLRRCGPSWKALKAFLDSSVGAKLHELDISWNKTLRPNEMKLIAQIFVQCGVKILRLAGCEPELKVLKAFLDSSVGAKLDELNVSHNTFGPDEMMVIAQICKQREVGRFRVGGCKFLPGALESFLFHSVDAKILLLDICNAIRFDEHDRILLGKIMKQCGVEILVVWSPLDLILIHNFKISTLKCGEDGYVTELREFSDSFCDSVSNFLPYVAKEIILINYHIPSRIVKFWQNRLDEERNKGFRLILKKRVFCDYEENVEGTQFKYKVLECKETPAENVPSIVENRKAELNNDGGITVSWCFPGEKSDVQYHVEASCNDQPTGNIEICRHPCYECKTPCPLQVYSFRIWVVISNGLAGTAMFTNEIRSRGLVISESLRKEVGMDGDDLSVGDCSAVFPRNSFLLSTEVALTAEIDSSKWPKDFLVLTPTLYVNAKGLQRKVCIKLRSWGVINEKNISMFRILHLPTGSNEWEDTGIALSFINGSFLEFEWHDFSPVLGGIWPFSTLGIWPFRSQNKAVDYLISGSVFASEFNEFSIAFHVNNDLVFKSVLESMAFQNPPKHLKLTTSPFSATLGETVETAMTCHDSGFFLEPPGPFSFTVKSYLAKAPEIDYTVLSSDWQAEKRVILKGEIKKNGNRIEPGSFGFADMWKPREGPRVDAEEVKRQPPPPKIPDPKLVLEVKKIRVSWHKLEDEHVTYCIDLYCNGQKHNADAPYQTPATYLLFSELEPYTEYRCQVWARNSHGLDGLKTWSNAVETEKLRERHPTPEDGGNSNEGEGSSTEAFFSSGNAPINITHSTITVSDTRGSRDPVFVPMQRENEIPHALVPHLPFSVSEPSETRPEISVAEIHPRQNFDLSNFDQPSTSRRMASNTGGTMYSRDQEQYYFGAPGGSVSQGYGQMQAGVHDFPNTLRSRHFGQEMETPPRSIVAAEEARRQAPPPEITDPKLALEKIKIRVTWDELKNERVTYCIELYGNGQKLNPDPCRTPATYIEFSRLEPSCEYRCEVWARNSFGLDGLKTWSNAVKTDEGFQAPASSSQNSDVPQVVIKEMHVGGDAFVGGRGENIDKQKKDQKSLKSGRSGED